MGSKITEAVVYLSGAQITRTQTFKLKKGVNSVTFADLPYNMNGQSVTASSDGKCIVLAVTHSTPYAKAGDKRISDLYKKLEELRSKQEMEQKLFRVMSEEEDLIRKNSLVSNGKTFRSEDVKATTEFFRERMSSICKEKFDSEKRIEKLSEEIYGIESEIGKDDDERRRSVVDIEVHCQNDTESELTVSYFTYNASWTPYYDIRVKDVEGPVQIASKATVYQNTGEDWNEVPLTLSTGDPTLGGDVPELNPWYIDFYEPVQPRARVNEYQMAAPMASRMEAEEECLADIGHAPEPRRMTTRQTESVTSVEYSLPVPYTVPSSGNGKSVDIMKHELIAEYIYKSVRKLEKDVFLLAEIKEWEHLNLIAGGANIFFEDKYVGCSNIDPRRAEEGLRISLGRDKNIIVTRVKGKDLTARSAMGP
ncbi:MAG: mucoidy inhibitor MuiA family protein, partial [Methanomassiliicoccaceae archaeon]|nr:mucoidy inhibitor MuiA family protein [Methanomassiliicoccaceae archaeon]